MAIQGVGHVGAILADKLAADGAQAGDLRRQRRPAAAVAARTGARVVATDAIFDADCRCLRPLRAGRRDLRRDAAAAEGQDRRRRRQQPAGRRGDRPGAVRRAASLYAPDFVINGGGIINVAAEIRALERGEAFDPAWVETKVAAMIDTLGEVLDRSAAERRPADQIAVQMAKERIAAARR